LSLRVHIHRLRRTFHPFGVRIESMVGVGYCLSVDRVGRSEKPE
jgi:DNA-binding response OmpR family regulator